MKFPAREQILRQQLPQVRAGGNVFALGELCAPPRIAVFDLDGTLIPCEFVDQLAACRGLAHLTRELTAGAVCGQMDFRTSYMKRLEILCGTPVALVEHLIEELPLAAGAAQTIDALHAMGCRTAIITGGYARVGRAIQRQLGIETLYATELEERDGLLTGRLASPLLDEQGKVDALTDFCARHGALADEAMAVGDGANDLKMLAAAGLAVLYTSVGGRPMTEIIRNFAV